MTEARRDEAQQPAAAATVPAGQPRRSWPGHLQASLLVCGVLVLLAAGSLLFPARQAPPAAGVFLVFDSSGDAQRPAQTYEPLRSYLAEVSERSLALRLVSTVQEFRREAARAPDFALCPDGLALGLAEDGLLPLAVGRRAAPQNLRPRSVLLYRLAAGVQAQPWLSRPEATVAGDSLSLAATGAWRRREESSPSPARPLAFGPDPYDHSPVLQAARLGCFDYALVRQWDAERFFRGGLLSAAEWGMTELTPPVPDLVLLAGRALPAALRLTVGEELSGLGRAQGTRSEAAAAVEAGLGRLRLAGFNVLIQADWDHLRRAFADDWPPAAP